MSQPKWKFVANLGDVNPLDYGGYFVFVDETGVYPPEAELLVPPEDEDGTYEVRRFILEDCTFIDGVLSDNKYHPDHPAWFAKTEKQRLERPQDTTYLSNLVEHSDVRDGIEGLAASFCSDNPVERAWAWRCVGEYHGFANLDDYPLMLTREEAEQRYADVTD